MLKGHLTAPPELLLASGSRYRAELLQRLRLPFQAITSEADETQQPGEAADTLALRLAHDKAAALRDRFPQAWIIGSDQVAVLDGRVLGKPGNAATAHAQLSAASGRSVNFLTAVALDLPYRPPAHALDVTQVQFRKLSDASIRRYIEIEPAFDCAGSFKCEGYGITLFEHIRAEDPTALIGLPLIAVARLLREAGYPGI
ncbi:septum formation protein Maf [Sinimarinibacterium sp. CAU 1509]|uniref:Maf family protein n=1 Tax=Sinimarinibacterium sp. CAU 1509 TaxID=2562283 RepID=UPI0010AC8723|nr:nucleoside triphosphate pyrophosphatase [Sinimarinibacterium sp. CAU 1509]TJY61147.1 septum formation protein Maf [Sinimarinibacterium sp. CAU 1509]